MGYSKSDRVNSQDVNSERGRHTGIAQFADNRVGSTAQLKLQTIMNASPQAIAQRKAQVSMQSPLVTQKQILQCVGDEELLQGKFATAEPIAQLEEKPNNTGLPNQLKAGIESLSGMSMDHVKVHYNSDKPAQLNAHAYAQGSDIHVASGQEKHLPHEAWHVVQQAQGRVRPTMQMKAGVPVNDDVGLETEADVMGEKALGVGQLARQKHVSGGNPVLAGVVVQAKTDVKVNLDDATDTKTANKKINTPTQGEKWFRFAKDSNKINSFANNITTQSPAGSSPVSATIELADAVEDTGTITDMSRAKHFSLGDGLIGKSADYRTGTWTWHHKVDPYKMELVDMHAHGGFYHYGGFSQWDMDDDDSSD